MKYRTLSPMQKNQIVGMRKAGMKYKDIAEVFSAPCSTISTILSHWKVHGSLESLKSQCGRPKKLSERDFRVLCHAVSSNRRHTLVELANLVSVSRTTVRFYLCELGFRNCIAPKKPYLNVKHKADRLAFARAYESWTFEDWCNIIWTDESSFETGKNPQQIRVWRKAYEKYNWDCIAPSFKSGHSSVMVWGAFTGFDKSPLVIIPLDKRSARDFVPIVYEGVLSGFYFLHDDPEQLILMEDGAPVHRSSLPLQWRRAHGIEKLFWPANSPDLNPIENVWMVVKDLLKHHSRPNSKLEMIEKIQSVWDTISIEWLRTLISTMPYRMQAVIAARGGSTRW
uniref:Tc1-like transposase DDE domain-containing protein n=1 Tax=Physcomitrium patens TaxID=3218 RepID=A0A2K1IHM3_PHYPA|nr:hypothetical protein PHYPA_029353 [Physcomitrium patens]